MESEIPKTARDYSFIIQYITIFLSSLGFSITFPSMWPYLEKIDDGAKKKHLGLVIAIFSVGQFLGGPIFGVLAQKMKSFKRPLIMSLVLVIIGNYLYANILLIKNKKVGHSFLIVSRFITGFGAGNVAITRAYITTFSESKYITERVSTMSACQSVGFILGPSFQALITFLGYPGYFNYSFFKLNMFTGCGYLAFIACIINLVSMIFLMKDRDPNVNKYAKNDDGTDDKKVMTSKADVPVKFTDDMAIFIRHNSSGGSNINNQLNTVKDTTPQVVDFCEINENQQNIKYFIVILVSLVFLMSMFFYSALETILTPMIMDHLTKSAAEATFYSSIILAVAGVCSVFIFIGIKYLSKIITNRVFMAIGQISMILSGLLLIPMIGPKPILSPKDSNKSGCPIEQQKWCDDYPALQLWAILLSIIIFTFGFALCSVSTTVLFSNALGSSPQTLWMGILTSVGSSSRIIGPFYISIVYDLWGQVVSFGAITILNFIILAIFTVFYKTLQ